MSSSSRRRRISSDESSSAQQERSIRRRVESPLVLTSGDEESEEDEGPFLRSLSSNAPRYQAMAATLSTASNSNVIIGATNRAATSRASGGSSGALPLARAVPVPEGGVAAAANVPQIELVAQAASSNTAATTDQEDAAKDIPELLVQIPQDNLRDVAQAWRSFHALIHTSKPDWQTNARDAVSLGAPTVIVATMKKWPQQELVQYYGCLCLVLLAFQNSAAKVMTARTGGINAIVAAMKAHPDSKRLQYQACQALQNILANPNAHALQDSANAFVDINGVTVVLDAMKRFMDDVNLQLRGMTVFLNLSTFNNSRAYRATMIKAGAVSLVGTIVEHHVDNDEVKETAKLCVNKLLG